MIDPIMAADTGDAEHERYWRAKERRKDDDENDDEKEDS